MIAVQAKNDSATALLLEKGAAVDIANKVSVAGFICLEMNASIFEITFFVVVG